MVNIPAGAMMNRYAEKFNCTIDDVVDWVNSYVNGQWHKDMKPHVEATEAERMASIKKYIASEVAG